MVMKIDRKVPFGIEALGSYKIIKSIVINYCFNLYCAVYFKISRYICSCLYASDGREKNCENHEKRVFDIFFSCIVWIPVLLERFH